MADRDGMTIEDLEEGQSASYSKIITEQDIVKFAEISGDTNPVHLDAEYATGTVFKERIAHGMLSASLISTVLGTKLPGPGAIYLSQTLKFKAPVKIGDEVTATGTITKLNRERRRATIECVCTVGGKPVIEGEAMVMVPSREG